MLSTAMRRGEQPSPTVTPPGLQIQRNQDLNVTVKPRFYFLPRGWLRAVR